jgi:hypothetical protein
MDLMIYGQVLVGIVIYVMDLCGCMDLCWNSACCGFMLE